MGRSELVFSIKNEAHIVLKDSRTGKIKAKRTEYNDYYDYYKRYLIGASNDNHFINGARYIFLGEGIDQTDPMSNMGLYGDQIGPSKFRSSFSIGIVEKEGKDVSRITAIYKYNAGEGTGTINEISFAQNSSSDSGPTSRILLSTPIEKGEYDELEITYYRYLLIEDYSGVIIGGTKDGLGDVTWKFNVTSQLLSYVIRWGLCGLVSRNKYNYLSAQRDNLQRFGTSNAINSFSETGLKGSLIGSQENYASQVIHNQDDYYSEIQLELETNEVNGNIGEINFEVSSESDPGCRITFDPPLEKDENHRLYLTIRFTFDWGD